MRRTQRKTGMHLLEPRDPEQSWLYEMGIPIQPVETPWDVDVQQKVPMPPNRTEVPTRYLNAVYAEVANAGFGLLPDEEFGENWVKTAMNEERTSAGAVAATVHGRYGDRVLFTSNDADANMKASEEGYQLVNPRSLTPGERERFREDAQVQSAREVFGVRYDNREEFQAKPEHAGFIRWVRELGQACGLEVTVAFTRFTTGRRPNIAADCTADSEAPTVRFNRAVLDEEFFLPPYNRTEQLELVIHEFGHAIAGKGMEHGPQWGQGAAKAGARIARHLAEKSRERPRAHQRGTAEGEAENPPGAAA